LTIILYEEILENRSALRSSQNAVGFRVSDPQRSYLKLQD